VDTAFDKNIQDLYENQIKLGQNLIEIGEAKKAKNLFNKLLNTSKDDYRIYLGLADSSFALNMNMYARNYYEQALNIDNTNTDTLAKYAQVLYELKDYENAISVLDKITDEKPQDDKSFYNKALINYEMKDYQNADSNLMKAIFISPNQADYYYLHGMVFEAMGNSKDAVYAYERFLENSTDETLKTKIQSKTKVLYDGIVK